MEIYFQWRSSAKYDANESIRKNKSPQPIMMESTNADVPPDSTATELAVNIGKLLATYPKLSVKPVNIHHSRLFDEKFTIIVGNATEAQAKKSKDATNSPTADAGDTQNNSTIIEENGGVDMNIVQEGDNISI